MDDVKDNVKDEELVEVQQSSVNGAREEKEDEEVSQSRLRTLRTRCKRSWKRMMIRMRRQTATPPCLTQAYGLCHHE